MKRFTRNGGVVVRKRITDLDAFVADSEYDVIVNCSGLGSKTLLNDDQMYAVRGQVSRVRANWIFSAVLDESDDGNYIIPKWVFASYTYLFVFQYLKYLSTESVVLGGTHQERDYNTKVCQNDRRMIVDGCQRYIPGLEHTECLFDWVGLRPGRTQLRLEAERRGRKLLIHNYGHGGSGVTLCWGCADDVLNILLAAKNGSKL